MKFLDRFNKKSKVAALVQTGIANTESVSVQQVRDCVFLLRNALGETWKLASSEAAAGMALLTMARDIRLHRYLNRRGWTLVLSFVNTNPEMASRLSPRTIGEIFRYREALPAPAA